MTYQIDIDHDNRVVLCTFEGVLNIDVGRRATGELNEKALELNYSKLYNVSAALLSVSMGDTCYFPRELLGVFNNKNYKKLKIAIYFSNMDNQEFWTFYNNTSQNVGFIIEIFTSKNEAIQWLSS